MVIRGKNEIQGREIYLFFFILVEIYFQYSIIYLFVYTYFLNIFIKISIFAWCNIYRFNGQKETLTKT